MTSQIKKKFRFAKLHDIFVKKIVFLLLEKSVTVVENDKMRKLKMNSFDHGTQKGKRYKTWYL